MLFDAESGEEVDRQEQSWEVTSARGKMDGGVTLKSYFEVARVSHGEEAVALGDIERNEGMDSRDQSGEVTDAEDVSTALEVSGEVKGIA